MSEEELPVGEKASETNATALSQAAGATALEGAESRLSATENASFSGYRNAVDAFTRGPQIEGLDEEKFQEANNDPSTIKLEVGEGEQKAELPFLTPLKYAPWINSNFFQSRGYVLDDLYFCALPQELLKENQESVKVALAEFGQANPAGKVLIDYPEESQPFYKRFDQGEPAADQLITSVGTPAATFHYAKDFFVNPEGMKAFQPDPDVRLVETPEEIDEHFEEIWDIYSRQFQGLVDDHPVEGALPKEELLRTLTSSDTRLYLYKGDSDRVQAFSYLVEDLNECPWLNQAEIKKGAATDSVVYLPGIAAAPECNKSVGVSIMITMLHDVLKRKGDFRATFECSNISATYIPKLVERTAQLSGIATGNPLIERRHLYEVVDLNNS